MISVIAAAYNNPDEVKVFLDSIAASSGMDFPFEVIIVDDGSTSLSIKEVVDRRDFARYIRLEQNSGAATARNTGAREAKYNSLVFFDSDVAVHPDTLLKARRYFDDPKIEAFIGRLDDVPLNKGFFPRYKAIMFNSWLPPKKISTVFTPAVGGVKKDVFFKCGGFDESIKGATVEYVKFSYELRKRCAINFYSDIVVRVKINSFRKALYTDFYSTMKWVTIFARYRMFDNHCTSISGGLGRLFGFMTLAMLPMALFFKLYAVWIAVFAAYLYLNRRFFFLILAMESAPFFLRSVLTHLMLSVMTILGAAAGAALVICGILFSGLREAGR